MGRPVKVCFYYSTWPAAPHSQACHAYRHCMSALYVCKAQSLGACMHERPLLLLISSCSWTHQKQSLLPPPPRDMPPAAVQCLRPACHYSWPYGNGGGVAMKGLVAGQKLVWREPSCSNVRGIFPFCLSELTSPGTTKSVFTHCIIHKLSPVARDHLDVSETLMTLLSVFHSSQDFKSQ